MPETAQYAHADVFVSYSSHDRDQVMEIVQRLRSASVTVWIDNEKIDGGTKWAAEIVQAIEACKVVLLMCSDASMRSWAVTQEVQLAGENQKYLLPLLLEKSSFPAQMKYFLTGVHWVEIFGRPPRAWMTRTLRALKRAGVTCDEMAEPELAEERVIQPAHLDWTLDGLRSVARFTDQLWVFPAEHPITKENPSPTRGLGEAQTSAQHSYRIGSRIRIGIESEKDGHLLLLDEGPEQKIFCLCPSHFSRYTRLAKGIAILPHPHSPYDAFILTGVPGREQLLAIITDEPLNFDWMPSSPTAPARILHQNDIDDLLTTLQAQPNGTWTALASCFDVVPEL